MMRYFNSTAALAILIMYLFLVGFETIIIGIMVAVVAGVAFGLIFKNKTVIAFDAGGVVWEGDFWTEKIREKKGMKSLLRKLKQNYKVILLSNNNEVAYKALEKDLGLGNLFDEAIVSSAVGIKKPDKAIFNYVLKKFNIMPKNLIFIDDSMDNVKSAQSLGARGLHFVSPEKLVTDLRRMSIEI